MMTRITVACVLFATSALSAQVGTNDAVYGRYGVSGTIAVKTSLNLNQTNTDNAVTVGLSKYIVRKVTVTNCSTSLAASIATIGVFTSTGGGGTAVVSLGLLTSLTGASKYLDMTVAVTADTLTAATLQIRNGVAHGGAATCDVIIFGDVLP